MNLKEKIINYFYDEEEWDICRPYVTLIGKVVIVSTIVTILVRWL